jgi:predicted dehydrogenase
MLDETGIDAVLIATPATFHARFCCEALLRGIYVLSEVPAVVDFQEARDLWEAQQASDAFYMLGANPNMWGFVEKAVELLREGRLGSPYYMEAEYIHDIRYLFDLTPWRETYESIRYCTHSLGPLLRLIDEDLQWVSSFGTGSHINQRPDQHDAMVAIFRTPSNVVVRLLTSFINNYPGCTHGYRVYATKGYFERKPGCEGIEPSRTLFCSVEGNTDKKLVELPVSELHPAFEHAASEEGHGGADYIILFRFFEAIRDGLPSPISLREALRMTLPGVFAAQSARAGGMLTRIEYPWSAGS